MKKDKVVVVGWCICLVATIAILARAGEYFRGRESKTANSAAATALTETSGTFLIGDMLDYRATKGYIVIGPPSVSSNGVGLQDSGRLVLKTIIGDRRLTLDSIYRPIPCTLFTAKVQLLGDTLFGERMELEYFTRDSTSVDGLSWDYRIYWWIVGR